jgi:hypothetical protein
MLRTACRFLSLSFATLKISFGQCFLGVLEQEDLVSLKVSSPETFAKLCDRLLAVDSFFAKDTKNDPWQLSHVLACYNIARNLVILFLQQQAWRMRLDI